MDKYKVKLYIWRCHYETHSLYANFRTIRKVKENKKKYQKETNAPQNKQITIELILCWLTLPGNMTIPGRCLKAAYTYRPTFCSVCSRVTPGAACTSISFHFIVKGYWIVYEGSSLSASFSESLVCYLTILI